MPFYLDDIPAEPFVIEPPETVSLEQFTAAEALLIDPTGASTVLAASIEDDEAVHIDPPAAGFDVEGLWKLRATLTNATARQQLPDAGIVVQDPDSGWHTLDSVRAEWPDADIIPDPSLWALLATSKLQVVTFAPALTDDAPIPLHYREAQRIQARNIWTAAKVSPDGGLGGDDFIVRPFPLDWHVKQILRPRRGVPVVG